MNAALLPASSPILPAPWEVPGAAWTRLRLSLGRSLATGEAWQAGVAYGVSPEQLQRLAEHWHDGFALPESLQELPRFEVQLGAEPMSFVHARASEPQAVPLLLLHSYGSSAAEFSAVIEPLRSSSLHVVCPELPVTGAAEACATLMRRLGYERYAVHGSDLGASVALELAAMAPESVAALHVTQLPTYPAEDAALTSAEKSQLASLTQLREELWYQLPENALQALAYALSRCDEAPCVVALLASLTWSWTLGRSHDRSYRESFLAPAPASTVPVVVHDFPLGPPSLSRFARLSHRVVEWNDHDSGGASPAWERPDWLVRSLRSWCAALV